jgi:peptidoglycan/LPS O-acetylase OafA/YrhL
VSHLAGGGVYLIVVATGTALIARHKGRNTVVWFVAGIAGSLALLLLVSIAPHAGRPWGARKYVAIALFGGIALVVVLVIVAVSQANFVTP